MHIKSPETLLMYKRQNEPETIPKFNRAVMYFYVAFVKKLKGGVGGGSVYRFTLKGGTFPLGTTSFQIGNFLPQHVSAMT